MSMSYSSSETFQPATELGSRREGGMLSGHVKELQVALKAAIRHYPNTKGEEYKKAQAKIVEEARTFRRERLRSWGYGTRGELIIEGERGANIQITKNRLDELVVENTALIWEPKSLDEQQVRTDAQIGGPVGAAHGAAREQFNLPLLKTIRSNNGVLEGEIAAYYDRQTQGQPQAVEFSYIDPLGETKHECITAARNGTCIRRQRTETGDSVVTENLGAQYDLSKEFDILESRVQESVHIRALGELAQKEFSLLTNSATKKGDYASFIEGILVDIEESKSRALHGVRELDNVLSELEGKEAEALRADLQRYERETEAQTAIRTQKVQSRSATVLSAFDGYKQRFAQELGDRSGVLVSKAVTELVANISLDLDAYAKKVYTMLGRTHNAKELAMARQVLA